MSFDLAGKVALVTGGGRDIGRAVSMELARNGAHVAVNYHQSREQAEETVREIQKLGRKAVAISANITRKGDIDQLVQKAIDFGKGRIDILVNNAGGLVRRAHLDELTEELIDE